MIFNVKRGEGDIDGMGSCNFGLGILNILKFDLQYFQTTLHHSRDMN